MVLGGRKYKYRVPMALPVSFLSCCTRPLVEYTARQPDLEI